MMLIQIAYVVQVSDEGITRALQPELHVASIAVPLQMLISNSGSFLLVSRLVGSNIRFYLWAVLNLCTQLRNQF